MARCFWKLFVQIMAGKRSRAPRTGSHRTGNSKISQTRISARQSRRIIGGSGSIAHARAQSQQTVASPLRKASTLVQARQHKRGVSKKQERNEKWKRNTFVFRFKVFKIKFKCSLQNTFSLVHAGTGMVTPSNWKRLIIERMKSEAPLWLPKNDKIAV